VLQGKKVTYIPGWDCHGLPIELKALQNLSSTDGTATAAVEKSKSMTALEIRTLARELASKTITAQKAEFKEWAVMADWERAYKTMDKHYELGQLEVFKQMLKKGLIYRRFKPVYWSPSSGTALAEAELEYNEKHASKAAFIKFALRETVGGENGVNVVIWTTTPWTIPANKAIAVGEDMEYVVLQTLSHGKLLVARDRVEHLRSMLGDDELAKVIKSGIAGGSLVGLSYIHPLLPTDAPAHFIISANFVSADSGTGLVHLAPGHGMDDYLVCLTHNIPPFSPVDNNGRYTVDTIPLLQGKEVLYAGTKAVLQLLETTNSLVHLQNKFTHKYPYDWRTKLPVIVRSTAQWFADAEGIKESAVKALDSVRFIPEAGRSRLTAFVKGRSEWCISRQRSWGVPIPALYDSETGEPFLTEENVDHIINVLSEKGTDAWFSPDVPDSVFLSPQYRNNGHTYVRGMETMDVWFDSGTSWATLARLSSTTSTTATPQPIADLYLEGSDQHRGWFQSSLLTSIASTSTSPFKSILTHGFVLDHQGKKMSKSLGNVILPADIISGSLLSPTTPSESGRSPPAAALGGINLLRLWVACCDFTRDVSLGREVLSYISEMLRKARVTARFCLGNLTDFTTAVPHRDLTVLDRLALAHASRVHAQCIAAYAQHSFPRAVAVLATYTSSELSAFYLDVVKDRLYSSHAMSPARRSAQTVLLLVLRNYVSLLSPLLPVLAQEVWLHAPRRVLESMGEEERGMLRFFAPPREWEDPLLVRDFEKLEMVHDAVKKGIEALKAKGVVKVNLETEVTIQAEGKLMELLKRYRGELRELFIVSGVQMGEMVNGEEVERVRFELDGEEGWVGVRRTQGKKCVRCWTYHAHEEGGVCARCEEVLKEGVKL
jgi:isoleucyl-tRNA synthetase